MMMEASPSSVAGPSGSSSSANAASKQPSHKSFTSLHLSPPLLRSLNHLAITVPTPIQSLTIPTILSGSDLIGGSPTGTGKTLCFALPILHSLLKDPVGGHSLILTPTRELAIQLHEQFLAIANGAKMGIKISLVLGGMDMMKQAVELSRGRPHILVATPGRLWDLLKSGGNQEWGLDRCKYLVMDEADRLLKSDFAPALSGIMDVLPSSEKRQTLLFSATLTQEIESLAEQRLQAAKMGAGREIRVEKIEFDAKTPPNLKQRYIFVPSHVREVYLYHLLTHSPSSARSHRRVKARRQSFDEEEGNGEDGEDLGSQVKLDDDEDDEEEDSDESDAESSASSQDSLDLDYSSAEDDDDDDASDSEAERNYRTTDTGLRIRHTVTPTIIFVSRCETAELLTRTLNELGLPTLALHSRLSQSTRTHNLQTFRRGPNRHILISTDVGSRGLDIPEVELVVNFDIPRAWEDYIHRVGRTARAGRLGYAVSFIGERDIDLLTGIEDKIGLKLKELEMPEERVLEKLNKVATAKRVGSMALADAGFGEREKKNKEKENKKKKRSSKEERGGAGKKQRQMIGT